MNEYILMITFSSLLTDLHPASSAGDRARLPSKASAGHLSSLSYKKTPTQRYKFTYKKIQIAKTQTQIQKGRSSASSFKSKRR